jgi:hypothetical protein
MPKSSAASTLLPQDANAISETTKELRFIGHRLFL